MLAGTIIHNYSVLALLRTSDYICSSPNGKYYLLVPMDNPSQPTIDMTILKNTNTINVEDFHRYGEKACYFYRLKANIEWIGDMHSLKFQSEVFCLSIFYSLLIKILKPLLQRDFSLYPFLHFENIWVDQNSQAYLILNQREQVHINMQKQTQRYILQKVAKLLMTQFRINFDSKTFLSSLLKSMINLELSLFEVQKMLTDKQKRRKFQFQHDQKDHYSAARVSPFHRTLQVVAYKKRRSLKLKNQDAKKQRKFISFQNSFTNPIPPSFRSKRHSVGLGTMFNSSEKRNKSSEKQNKTISFTENYPKYQKYNNYIIREEKRIDIISEKTKQKAKKIFKDTIQLSDKNKTSQTNIKIKDEEFRKMFEHKRSETISYQNQSKKHPLQLKKYRTIQEPNINKQKQEIANIPTNQKNKQLNKIPVVTQKKYEQKSKTDDILHKFEKKDSSMNQQQKKINKKQKEQTTFQIATQKKVEKLQISVEQKKDENQKTVQKLPSKIEENSGIKKKQTKQQNKKKQQIFGKNIFSILEEPSIQQAQMTEAPTQNPLKKDTSQQKPIKKIKQTTQNDYDEQLQQIVLQKKIEKKESKNETNKRNLQNDKNITKTENSLEKDKNNQKKNEKETKKTGGEDKIKEEEKIIESGRNRIKTNQSSNNSMNGKKSVSKQVNEYLLMINKMGEAAAKSSKLQKKMEGIQWFTGVYFLYKRFILERKKIQSWLEKKQPKLSRYGVIDSRQWEQWIQGEQRLSLLKKVKQDNQSVLDSIIKMHKKISKKDLPGNIMNYIPLNQHSPQQSKIIVSEVVKQYDELFEKQMLKDTDIHQHICELINALFILGQIDGKIKEKKSLVEMTRINRSFDELEKMADDIYEVYIPQNSKG